MRHSLVLTLLLIGCSTKPGESNHVGDTSLPPQSTAVRRPVSGNYFGSSSTVDGDVGEYLKLSNPGSALYDGLRWIRICEVTQNDAAISFRTAPLFGRVFEFRGTAHGDELRGQLTGFAQPLDLVFHRLDEARRSGREGHEKSGFYSDLTYIEEAGDNVGAELLVGSIAGRRAVAFMIAEGSAGLPQIGIDVVEVGDTLRFALSRDSTASRVTAVFLDSAVKVSLNSEDEGARRLRKSFSLQAFYDQPTVGKCPP